MNRWNRLGSASALGMTLAGVAVACSATAPAPAPAQESTEAVSAAIVAKSCQALDIGTYFTDPDNGGATNFAVDPNGNLLGWGFNGPPNYPLGFNNAITAVTKPVSLGVANATKLAAHQLGACAITNPTAATAGSVTCVGQPLGGDAIAIGSTPGGTAITVQQSTDEGVTTVPLTGAVGIAAGVAHACVWKADGTAWCWGSDQFGQFGDGSYKDPTTGQLTGGWVSFSAPFAVQMLDATGTPLKDVQQIAIAQSTTCVLHTTGVVQCVGSNAFGELGVAGGATNATPTGLFTGLNLAPGTTFASITGGGGGNKSAAGGAFCASATVASGATTQATYCWGYNPDGQVNYTNALDVTSPVQVSSDLGSSWAQGTLNACEVTAAGAVKCWGANSNEELPGVAAATPVFGENTIPGISSVFKVAIGHEHMCALGTNNLWCWGNNQFGELGNSSTVALPAGASPSAIHIVPPAVCPASYQCGTVTNSCGETTNCGAGAGDCGGQTESGAYTCTNHQCVKNPNYCSPACGWGQYCQNNTCLGYCGTNPLTSAAVGTTVRFPTNQVNSPATYGSNGCGAYIVDLTSATNANTYVFGAWPTTSYTNQTDCQNSRGTTTFYVNGVQLGASQVNVGQWLASGSSGFCNYAPAVAPAHGASELRVAVTAEHATTVKGSLSWSEVPVTMGSLPSCLGCGL